MISTKMASPGLLKIKVFWNYAVISVLDITKKVSPSDLNHTVDMVMWPKFGNSSISTRELKVWPEKPLFLKGALGSSSMIWDWL